MPNIIGIGILVSVILLAIFAPMISNMISNADDVRVCTTAGFENECLDLDDGLINWCSNETDGTTHCTDPKLLIYNVSTSLCTNASGVRVVNGSATSVCDSIGWEAGIMPYSDAGLNVIETTILRLAVLFLVLGVVFMIGKPLMHKN